MTDGMSLEMLLSVAAIGLTVAFFVGCAMNGVMGAQGFGSFGNMLVLSAGFVLGLSVTDRFGDDYLAIDWTTAAAIFAAFCSLFLAAIFKRVALRF